MLTGCAASAPKIQKAPVFYPPPPDLPRIQFLTSLSGSKDVESKTSSFERFVTGEKEAQRRLNKPYGLAVQKGKIYVCDTNATLMVFDLEKSTFGPLHGAQGLGMLTQPQNISIDSAGNRYVADPVRGQVVMFDKNDFYVKAFGTSDWWKPVSAAVFEGSLYVSDMKNNEIKVVDLQTGNLLRGLGQREGNGGVLGMPANLVINQEGYLFVSDAGRFQVVKLDRDGNIRQTMGQLGSQPGYFARPRGIAFDREGRFYVVDAAFDNVQVFNKDGGLLLFFGKAGRKDGDLFLPAQVAIDYENIPYFQKFADPSFEIEHLIFVTSQFGERLVNVYAFGRERGKEYPSDEKLREELKAKLQKLVEQEKEKEKKKKESGETNE
jgi:DNA-binding beta-propeller fold protein YncE